MGLVDGLGDVDAVGLSDGTGENDATGLMDGLGEDDARGLLDGMGEQQATTVVSHSLMKFVVVIGVWLIAGHEEATCLGVV